MTSQPVPHLRGLLAKPVAHLVLVKAVLFRVMSGACCVVSNVHLGQVLQMCRIVLMVLVTKLGDLYAVERIIKKERETLRPSDLSLSSISKATTSLKSLVGHTWQDSSPDIDAEDCNSRLAMPTTEPDSDADF